jgi:hypothetical protein
MIAPNDLSPRALLRLSQLGISYDVVAQAVGDPGADVSINALQSVDLASRGEAPREEAETIFASKVAILQELQAEDDAARG